MTLAITISIILSATVLIAIVGLLTWSIMTSRDEQGTTPIEITSDEMPEFASTPNRIRTRDFPRQRQAS